MNKDVINIIGKFAHINIENIDIENISYKCENCNNNCYDKNKICCCIYFSEDINTSQFSDKIQIYSIIKEYNYKYLCEICVENMISNDTSILFYFKYLLQIKDLENLYEQIFTYEKEQITNKCLFDNIDIMEVNEENYYKSCYTNFKSINNKIILTNCLYENDTPLIKYFEGLNNIEKTFLNNNFKIQKYIQMTS